MIDPSPPSWPGLTRSSPAIGYPHQFANDAIPVGNHSIKMVGSSPATCGRGLLLWQGLPIGTLDVMPTRNISLTERLDRFVETNVSMTATKTPVWLCAMPCACCSSVIRRMC